MQSVIRQKKKDSALLYWRLSGSSRVLQVSISYFLVNQWEQKHVRTRKRRIAWQTVKYWLLLVNVHNCKSDLVINISGTLVRLYYARLLSFVGRLLTEGENKMMNLLQIKYPRSTYWQYSQWPTGYRHVCKQFVRLSCIEYLINRESLMIAKIFVSIDFGYFEWEGCQYSMLNVNLTDCVLMHSKEFYMSREKHYAWHKQTHTLT